MYNYFIQNDNNVSRINLWEIESVYKPVKTDSNKSINPQIITQKEFNFFYQSYSNYLENQGESPILILKIKEVDICNLFKEVIIVLNIYLLERRIFKSY